MITVGWFCVCSLRASFFFFFLSLEEAPASNWISQQAFIRRSSSRVLSDLQLIELNQDQLSESRQDTSQPGSVLYRFTINIINFHLIYFMFATGLGPLSYTITSSVDSQLWSQTGLFLSQNHRVHSSLCLLQIDIICICHTKKDISCCLQFHTIQGHESNGTAQKIKVMQISHFSQLWAMERDDQFLAACKQEGFWLADCCNTDLSLLAGRLCSVPQVVTRGRGCESQAWRASEGGHH